MSQLVFTLSFPSSSAHQHGDRALRAVSSRTQDRSESISATSSVNSNKIHSISVSICSPWRGEKHAESTSDDHQQRSLPSLSNPLLDRPDISGTLLADRTGERVWGCALLLSIMFALPRKVQIERQFPWDILSMKTAIELGAGTGFLGIALKKAGLAQVTITDLPQNLPSIQENVRANFPAWTSGVSAAVDGLRVKELVWGRNALTSDSSHNDATECQPPFDLIVLSEVLYWPGLDVFDDDTLLPLVETLDWLTKGDLSHMQDNTERGEGRTSNENGNHYYHSVVVLAYKSRDQIREKQFFDLCRTTGRFRIQQLAQETYRDLWVEVEKQIRTQYPQSPEDLGFDDVHVMCLTPMNA